MNLPFKPDNRRQSCIWFAIGCCVEYSEEKTRVFVGGHLVGDFGAKDILARNLLLIGLSKDKKLKKGLLAKAFRLSDQQIRRIRSSSEAGGLEAVPSRVRGGSSPKASKEMRVRLWKLFDEGLTAGQAFKKKGAEFKLSIRSFVRLRSEWKAERQLKNLVLSPVVSEQSAVNVSSKGQQLCLLENASTETIITETATIEAATIETTITDTATIEAATIETANTETAITETATIEAAADEQLFSCEKSSVDERSVSESLLAKGPKFSAFNEDGLSVSTLKSGKNIQHLGGLLLVAVIASYGLYEAAVNGWDAGIRWRDRLRMAFDAVILALGIGQKCVEGVRRLETQTLPLLLRTNKVPSESWVRRIIKRYVDGTGMASKLHLKMTEVYLESARYNIDEPAVFYVDNHMRQYTGKFTLRKGWRMQDKRVKPGVTDYYVHDEDGRPVCRVEAPSHDALTDFLNPIAQILRDRLEKGQRILVAFDRAGAFPTQMMKLHKADVEFVTYERRPYPTLSKSVFTEKIKLENNEIISIHESAKANLGAGRGEVRRISLLTEDNRQINILAVSQEPAWRLIEIITGRWVQENGFKHGKERWGINQLDRRKRLPYKPDTLIPNPTRRRLELSIKIAGEKEGMLRRKLALLESNTEKRKALETELQELLTIQSELKAERPKAPHIVRLEDSPLKGELTYHDPHYKIVLDTIRIACANAESNLSLKISNHLKKPAEAKKVLANIFASQGDLRILKSSITINLRLTGNTDEKNAIAALFESINTQKLHLPGDAECRPLIFKSNN